jgi:hypothetical protein
MTDLAQAIDQHLCYSDGVVSLADIQKLTSEGGHTLTDLNQALRELHAEGYAEYCPSCKSLISKTTMHQGHCPHGA